MANLINWFEIAVSDLARATRFYEQVLAVQLRQEVMDEVAMAIFPYQEPATGGALCQMQGLQPSADGVVIYLDAGADLSLPLQRVAAAGGQVLMPKTFLGENIGYIAWLRDSEGNRIGLHSMN